MVVIIVSFCFWLCYLLFVLFASFVCVSYFWFCIGLDFSVFVRLILDWINLFL